MDDEGWLHYFSKSDGSGVRRARIENAFLKRHLYSQIADDGRKDTSVEEELGLLEAQVEPILEKFVSASKAGNLPQLSRRERSIWDFFFIVQWRRVPDLHLTVGTDAEMREELSRIRQDMLRRFPHRADEIEALAEPETEKIVLHNARAQSVRSVGEQVLTALATRGIALLRLTAPGKSFIVASRPVVQLKFRGGQSLLDEPTEMWLPVSSELAVGIGTATKAEVIYDLSDHRAIRHLNVALASQSTAFGSRSKKLTTSIASMR